MKLIKKRLVWVAVTGIALLAIVPFLLPRFITSSELYCSRLEVDINTGRLRSTEFRFFRKVSEEIEESSLSKTLGDEAVAGIEPTWRKVHTSSLGKRNSPNHGHHRATHQIRTLERIWDQAASSGLSETEEFKKATARHVLVLWKYSGKDRLAGRYIDRLAHLAFVAEDATTFEAVTRLEMPVHEAEGDIITTTVYFPDGQPLERVQGYKGDSEEFIRHGTWEGWSSDGTLLFHRHFVDGRQH